VDLDLDRAVVRDLGVSVTADLVVLVEAREPDEHNLPRGAFTVRVLTGCHTGAAANPGHDAAVTIFDLASLPAVLAARLPALA
jgi:hypothetical protein